jgi:hypothetical protein
MRLFVLVLCSFLIGTGCARDHQSLSVLISQLQSEQAGQRTLAIQGLTELGNEGDAAAQLKLGLLYVSGVVVEKDITTGIQWLEKSALQQNPAAAYNLGIVYSQVLPSEQLDYSKAAKFFESAAALGDAQSAYELGVLWHRAMLPESRYNKESLEMAYKWFKVASDLGLASAQFSLAVYHQSKDSARFDFKEAKRLYQLAAEQGYPPAMYNLGLMLINGHGGKKDKITGAEWVEKAALSNFTDAQFNLAMLFLWGEGKEKDQVKAFAWLSFLSEVKHPVAERYYARLSTLLTEEQKVNALKYKEEFLKQMLVNKS